MTDNVVDGAFAKAMGWLPAWLGFVFAIAAGVAAVVAGIVLESTALIAFGAWAVAASIIAWVSGATAEPRLNPVKPSFGAVVTRIPMIPWLVIAGLFVVALIIALVV